MKFIFQLRKKKKVVENVTEGIVVAADMAVGFFTNISPIKSVKDIYEKVHGQLFEEKIESFMNGSKGFTKEEETSFMATIGGDIVFTYELTDIGKLLTEYGC